MAKTLKQAQADATEVLRTRYFRLKHCRRCGNQFPAHLFGLDNLALDSGICGFCSEAKIHGIFRWEEEKCDYS